MKNTGAHIVTPFRRWIRMPFFIRISGAILVLAFLLPFVSKADDENEPFYDEVPIVINVQGVGSLEVPAVILDEKVYLPIIDIFIFLKIRNNPSNGLDSITGFIINEDASYLVDKLNNRILYQGKTYNLNQGDLIQTATNLYLRADYFGKVFGLECTFNFRSLSVAINTALELPVMREMQQEQLRHSAGSLKGTSKVDTTYGRTYPLFHLGMIDWSIITSEEINRQSDAKINLSVGTIIAGGEANIGINYSSNTPFNEKQQYYLWRFVNNDYRALRQVLAGKIATQAILPVYQPVVGIQLTNTATTARRSFGTYVLSNRTMPGWTVELYINNVLIDHVKADASGFYTFQVPLVYGNSQIKLRFYGQWGEQRTQEETINIPFNFLPQNKFEYKVSAGKVEDSIGSRLVRGNFNYGLTQRMTIGGGVEYLSSLTSANGIPFVNASIRLASNLLVSGEHTSGFRSKGTLTYRMPANINFELSYVKYQKGREAAIFNNLEERKAVLSIPLRCNYFTLFSRLTYDQVILPTTSYTNAEWLLSGSVLGVGTNISTYKLFSPGTSSYTYSNFSLTLKLPYGFLFTPQAQYEYTQQEFISEKFVLEKTVFTHGFLNLSYEQNFKSDLRNITIGLRYDLSFAQIVSSVRRTNGISTFSQSARGSVLNNGTCGTLGTNNRTNVGKGGIVIIPYLDLNCNGIHEEGEPRIPGLKVHINAGRMEVCKKDTVIKISDLEPYNTYYLEVDRSSFDNISWQIRKPGINVYVDPNNFKIVEVPVAVAGEVSGTVLLKGENNFKGLGRIIVCFYNSDSSLVARTLTEADGYFSYLGLSPGSYTARVDSTQLNKLNLSSAPVSLSFTISPNREGDVADDLIFTLHDLINKTEQEGP